MHYAQKIHEDADVFEKYLEAVYKWDSIKSLDELCSYFQNRNAYKNEGLFHHYNSKEEFFLHGYDCEDVAFMTQKKLSELGYKTQVIGIMGSKATSWHYDVVYKIQSEGVICDYPTGYKYIKDIYMMFNYGKSIESETEKGCIDQLSTYTVNNEYVYLKDKTIWWRCCW
jgi:hypothetical protein